MLVRVKTRTSTNNELQPARTSKALERVLKQISWLPYHFDHIVENRRYLKPSVSFKAIRPMMLNPYLKRNIKSRI